MSQSLVLRRGHLHLEGRCSLRRQAQSRRYRMQQEQALQTAIGGILSTRVAIAYQRSMHIWTTRRYTWASEQVCISE
jgi:hypothetical protein